MKTIDKCGRDKVVWFPFGIATIEHIDLKSPQKVWNIFETMRCVVLQTRDCKACSFFSTVLPHL